MHKQTFCQKLFETALGTGIHKARKKCLSRFIGDLLDYDVNLSVTEIGKKLSPIFFGDAQELVVLIDWSGSCKEKLHTLIASIVGHGRSIPIYHQVFGESQLGGQTAHEQFLQTLRDIIPSHIKVIIITDAGFRTPWFREVISYGWDVIGRIHGGFGFQKEGEKEWVSLNEIDFGGTGKAYSLGNGKIGKKTKRVSVYVYTYKERLSDKPHKKIRNSPRHPERSEGSPVVWHNF